MRKEVIGKQTLYCGNSLELLDLLQDGAYGLVLTDPPYMINTKSDGTGKTPNFRVDLWPEVRKYRINPQTVIDRVFDRKEQRYFTISDFASGAAK